MNCHLCLIICVRSYRFWSHCSVQLCFSLILLRRFNVTLQELQELQELFQLYSHRCFFKTVNICKHYHSWMVALRYSIDQRTRYPLLLLGSYYLYFFQLVKAFVFAAVRVFPFKYCFKRAASFTSTQVLCVILYSSSTVDFFRVRMLSDHLLIMCKTSCN